MISRPSFFMLILIKNQNMKRSLPIILPVFAICDAIGAALSIFQALLWISPRLRRVIKKGVPGRFTLDQIGVAENIIYELASYGTWTFIDIATEDGTRVLVKFI